MEAFSKVSNLVMDQLCCFLVHRYLSDFLKTKIDSAQFSCDLLQGRASVEMVDLDTELLNNSLESSNLPLVIVDGFISKIEAQIPLKNILKSSCEISITGLQLTLKPRRALLDSDQADLVTSMIGSMVGSMATSMQIAEEFVKEKQADFCSEEGGTNRFAEVVDVLVSQFRTIFKNTVIRVESQPESKTDLCTAIEVQIDSFEFIDQQMDQKPEELLETKGSDKSLDAEEDFKMQKTVIVQPQPIKRMSDLNKVIHMIGVRLYTDIFSKPETTSNENSTMSQSGVNSISVRRGKEKSRKFSPSMQSTLYMSTDDSFDRSNYQSCYSNAEASTRGNTAVSFVQQPGSSANCNWSTRLDSNPIQFAEFTGQKQSVYIHIREEDPKDKTPSQAIRFLFDGLFIFVSPTQIQLINNCNIDYCGKPIAMEECNRLGVELLARNAALYQPCMVSKSTSGSTLCGSYDKQSVLETIENMADVSLSESSDTRFFEQKSKRASATAICSENDKLSRFSRRTSIGVETKVFFMVITHSDYLGEDKMCHRTFVDKKVIEVIDDFAQKSKFFFDQTRLFKLSKGTDVLSYRETLDAFFAEDHLRFFGLDVLFDYSLTKFLDDLLFELGIGAAKFEFSEVLTPPSIKNNQNEHLTYIDLISFPEATRTEGLNKDFKFKLKHSRKNQGYDIELDLSPCVTEFDMSLIDRISSLLVTEPFYKNLTFTSPEKSAYPSPIDFRNNYLSSAGYRNEATKLSFLMKCSKWNLKLRFPVAILLGSDKPSFRMRNVHYETLQLILYDASFQIPVFDVSQLGHYGNMELSASKLNGFFLGNSKLLQCSDDDMHFLFAGGDGNICEANVKLHIQYDFRDSSLKVADLCKSTVEKSLSASFMQTGEQVEGPFSVNVILHEMEKVIRVGEREELQNFSDQCLKHSNISIDLYAAQLRIHLPSRQFYEVLYNRLANDFCLWECNSPSLKKSGLLQASLHETSLEQGDEEENYLDSVPTDFEDDKSKNSRLKMRKVFSVEKPHGLSFALNAENCKVIVSFEIEKENTQVTRTRFCIDMTEARLFLVNGYHAVEGISYFYATSQTIGLHRHNLNDKPYIVDVEGNPYAKCSKQEKYIEPTSDEDFIPTKIDDNNFAIALHMDFVKKRNIKNIIIASGLNNSTFHVTSLPDYSHSWINQLANFFNVSDYAVLGYELPKTNMQVHAHIASTTFAYTYHDVKTDSKTHLRFFVGSSDISCDVVPDVNGHNFSCLVEESKLFLSTVEAGTPHVSFKQSPSVCMPPERGRFVKLLSIDNFSIEVVVARAVLDGDYSSLVGPLIQLNCKHGLIKFHVCADSLGRLLNMALGLLGTKNADESLLSASSETSPSKISDPPVIASMPDLDEELKKNAFEYEKSVYQGMGDSIIVTRRPSEASDEEYCIVDEIPGSGILDPDGSPRLKFLDGEVPCLEKEIDEDYNKIPVKTEVITLPKSYSSPVIKYRVQDFSFEVHLYGGNDFGKWRGSRKDYSVDEFREGSGPGQKIMTEEEGGLHRDYSVHVLFKLSKMRYQYEMFDKGPILCYHYFDVRNVEIHDKLVTSKIDKMMYQSLNALMKESLDNDSVGKFSSSEVPKREFAPMFAVRLVENHHSEGKLRISVLPIRLNFDLDTLEFLRDFFTEVSSLLASSHDDGATSNVPEIQASHEFTQNLYPKLSSSRSASPSQVAGERNQVSQLKAEAEEAMIRSNKGDVSLQMNLLDPKSDNYVKNLFEENDLKLLVDSNDIGASFAPNASNLGSRFCYNPEPKFPRSEGENLDEDGIVKLMDEQASSNHARLEKKEEATFHMESSDAPTDCSNQSRMRELYFKEFTFSPPVVIRLDFHGRRVIMDQGALIGLLSMLSNLSCTQLVLKDLHNVDGTLGLKRCVNYAIQEWTNDIANNQVAQIIGSYAPISSFVQLAKGVRDLLFMPVDEYRKKDGHVVRGLQKGAQSFGFSTAAVAVDLAQKMVGVIQGFAEIAFDIVSPDVPAAKELSHRLLQPMQGRPNDLKQGFHMAYEAVKDGVTDTAQVLKRAARENRSEGHWPLRYFLKQLTPTVLRPVVIGARATGHVLDGLKSQLSPDVYREEMEKWKKENLVQNAGAL